MISGKNVIPHLVKIGGLWRVRWRVRGEPGCYGVGLVHFMTANSKRSQEAKIHAANLNARLVAAGEARRKAARR